MYPGWWVPRCDYDVVRSHLDSQDQDKKRFLRALRLRKKLSIRSNLRRLRLGGEECNIEGARPEDDDVDLQGFCTHICPL